MPPPPQPASSPPRSPNARVGFTASVNASQRSSLESLAELEQLLEEQHQQLVARGFIPPSEAAPWKVGMGMPVASEAAAAAILGRGAAVDVE